ncbi:glycosyltransferase [Aliifodinibius sp. S!AR15-10]|uniref:glycosyltransferase family 2 protein n=1 Tax=Aliifodinibius sp. S!AR15-10 TaxID=2950437 RepID=UPI00285442A6|nr:glycosyltransferase family 2 protein [Aliifodinibius sp. S!AR15-10]MDR8390237.1 glycosyltransferase [Aliifodinibius sp. S!AR15-10]
MEMKQTNINKFPKPQKNETGWPWTVESKSLPKTQNDGSQWPKISIVTPSYNQGAFLEETIRSVLLQNYPNLEYIVIDGGSTDESVNIIKKYEEWITYWISEPDKGQSDAINKGFEKATGKYGNWINSDDLLAKDSLYNAANFLADAKYKTLFIGQCIMTDKTRQKERINSCTIQSFEELIDIKNYWRNGNSIAQQNVFFDLNSFRDVGGLNVNNHYAMDYELWGNLLLNGNKIEYLNFPVGIFRQYDGQKISNQIATTNSLLNSAKRLVIKQRGSLIKKLKLWIRLTIYQYNFCLRYFVGFSQNRIRIRKITGLLFSSES